jgi:tRNA threonylcarbamoyladenosine biosynthesis protein TsaB
MALILNIETATTAFSVALARNGVLFNLREENKGYTHSENLTAFIDEMMRESGLEYSQLDAIAVSSGPGSYTGLRIGISSAKGFCLALEKPLIAVPTLKSLAACMPSGPGLRCPMIDARRMEVYCAVYDENLDEVEPVQARIIDENSFAELLGQRTIRFFGDGAAKCGEVLAHQPHAVFTDGIFPTAKSMTSLAEEKFLKGAFENVALFEPFYLKEFLVGAKK